MTERVLAIGLGARDGTPAAPVAALLERLAAAVAQKSPAVDLRAAESVFATVDSRAADSGLAAGVAGWSSAAAPRWLFFTADELAEVAVPSPSAVVAERVGTPSVAEAAAILAVTRAAAECAVGPGEPVLLVHKMIGDRVTGAVAIWSGRRDGARPALS